MSATASADKTYVNCVYRPQSRDVCIPKLLGKDFGALTLLYPGSFFGMPIKGKSLLVRWIFPKNFTEQLNTSIETGASWKIGRSIRLLPSEAEVTAPMVVKQVPFYCTANHDVDTVYKITFVSRTIFNAQSKEEEGKKEKAGPAKNEISTEIRMENENLVLVVNTGEQSLKFQLVKEKAWHFHNRLLDEMLLPAKA